MMIWTNFQTNKQTIHTPPPTPLSSSSFWFCFVTGFVFSSILQSVFMNFHSFIQFNADDDNDNHGVCNMAMLKMMIIGHDIVVMFCYHCGR